MRRHIYDAGVIIFFGIIVAAMAAGVFRGVIGKDDQNAEEHLESYIEDEAEKHFGLEEDALKGKIDLTPWSEEPNSKDKASHKK